MKSAAGQLGARQRHVDADIEVVCHVNLVNQAQVVHVDGYFGVVYGLEHRHNLFFYFKFCHNLASLFREAKLRFFCETAKRRVQGWEENIAFCASKHCFLWWKTLLLSVDNIAAFRAR